jgi:hypothetical protein
MKQMRPSWLAAAGPGAEEGIIGMKSSTSLVSGQVYAQLMMR